MADRKVLFKIRRRLNPGAEPYWQEFELAWHPGMNVIFDDGDRAQSCHPRGEVMKQAIGDLFHR
ncbi:MAG: hypothetical protein ACRD2U_16525 [Terriglobales bacterium]